MTYQNEGAEARTDLDPQSPARHEHEEGTPSHEGDDVSNLPRSAQNRNRRKTTPPEVYRVPGNPGRVLVYLWTMASWSRTTGAAFVWPRLRTVESALGLWPTSLRRALDKLTKLGWIYRESREVSFDGERITRKGWVLNPRPSDGELFERVERADHDGDVVVGPPRHVVAEAPQDVVIASSIGTRSEPPPTHARAREEEVGLRPTDGKAPLETELWHDSERERTATLGGEVRAPTPERLVAARRLLDHVRSDGASDDAEAARHVRTFLRAAAAFAKARRDAGEPRYAVLRTTDPFSVKAYDHVMARVQFVPPPPTDAERAAARRAREFQWDDGRAPLRYDDLPDPRDVEPPDIDIGAMADEFLAGIAKVAS